MSFEDLDYPEPSVGDEVVIPHIHFKPSIPDAVTCWCAGIRWGDAVLSN